ncbi:MAG: ORC1-type DNA replication protein [Candidatus Heimdallarchaeota archaeon]|nr:ORC1-type DNA replication protein [Candidatus Heimdallarchaeota archaeon]
MDDLDYLDEELAKPSVFTDETKLSSEYVPNNLLFRVENLKTLARHYKVIFTDTKISKHMIISGPVGSGKTSLAKKLGTWVESKNGVGLPTMRYIHVNCRRNRSVYLILLSIARALNSHVPSRGYSSEELLEIIVELLEIRKTTLLLVMDELDYLKDDDINGLIYGLTRTNDERSQTSHKIALLLISQSNQFVDRLDMSSQSSLTPALMVLDPYSKYQLYKIIEDRVQQSFHDGAVMSDSIELAAEIAAARGDARRAVELMWFAGKYADKDLSSLVYPEHVRLAKADIEPSIIKKTIMDLPIHVQLLLLGIARELKLSHAAHITSGKAEESYQMACEDYGITYRKHTQIWEYLKELSHLGVINTTISGKGQRGTTQLISIQDVSAVELELVVQKMLQTSVIT